MLLDASQAFDRVDYVKLFQLLLKRGMCPIITRFLLNIYTNQTLCVRWGNIYSSTLEVSNGVKQGGVLSPILFNVYIDELLERLKKSGFGCHIGSKFMGAFCYADDCSLLAPSITSLKIMLKVVTQFSKEYNVKFNSAKSQLLVCSKDNHVVSNLSFNDSDICSSKDAYHLGHPVGANEKSMCLLRCKNDFVSKLNFIISNFGSCCTDVKYSLLKTFCMSLYGCVLWDLSDKSIETFYTTWRVGIRKLLNLPRMTHGKYLPEIVNDIPVECQLHRRVIKFVNSLFDSENSVIKCCTKLALNGSRSVVSRNINYVLSKYQLRKDEIEPVPIGVFMSKVRDIVIQKLNTDDQINIENIKCLIDMRDSLRNDFCARSERFFTIGDLNVLLEYFCVKL